MKINFFKGNFIPKTLVLLLLVNSVNAQEKSSMVTGIVQGNSNELLSGVTVTARNLKTNFATGTATDSSGLFTFSRLPSGGPYSFKFTIIGYEEQTLSGYNIKEGASLSLAVKLAKSNKTLDQVVVIGYGTQKRKDVTGAVGSVNGKDIKDLSVTRVEQALSGKVAGVQVKFSDGQPGNSPQVRVRGVGSISAGVDPLYVVDGFPTDNIQTINPNDIESMDILKDASATAIYGSRGSNGVVIINTRRGSSGKPKVSLDMYYGQQKISKQPEFLNANEQATYYYNSIRNRNLDLGNNVSGDPATWGLRVPQTVLDVLSGKNTNDVSAIDSVLRRAPIKSINISVTGGSESLRYAVSAEAFDQDGIVLNNNFKRYSFRSNFDAQLSKKFSIKFNLNPSFISQDNVIAQGTGAGASSSIIGTATSAQPYYPLHNPDGSYFVYNNIDASTVLYNPVALALEQQDVSTRTRVLANISAQYNISNNFRLNVLFGGNANNTKGHSFTPQIPAFFNNAAIGTDNSSSQYNWLAEFTGNYNQSFGKHTVGALVGYTAQEDILEINSLNSNKYPNNLVPYLSAVSGIITTGTASREEWSIVSQLARVNYNFDNRYLITASIRRDGSSRFGENNKYGVFPSAAIAWRVSNEEFFKGMQEKGNDLKLRLSYGETGNNNIGNYASLANINYLSYPGGGVAIGGYAPGSISNPNLTWETQQQLNIGADIGLLNGRVNLTIDHFISRNEDLLLNVNIPAASGFSTVLQNIGEVKNKGWEFALGTNLINTADWRWSADFNFSTYKNKVTKLGPSGDDIIVGNNITRIGQPIGMFYGYIVDGIFKNSAELASGPIYNKGLSDATRVGDIRFRDVNGPNGKPDGLIDNSDLTIIGSPYPDFYYGFTSRLSYKNFNLNFNVSGSHGAMIYSNAMIIYRLNRSRSRTLSTERNFWKSETDPGDGKTVRPVDVTTGGLRLPSTRYMDEASYLRLNNITLGYTIPDRLAQSIKLSSVRIYGSANNALIITNNHSFNADVSNSGNPLTPGIDLNNYPIPKSFVIGLNVMF